MAKIRVSQVKTASKGERRLAALSGGYTWHHWKIEQRTADSCVRVFIYSCHRFAIRNAVKIANGQPISTFGLRGFHIERRNHLHTQPIALHPWIGG